MRCRVTSIVFMGMCLAWCGLGLAQPTLGASGSSAIAAQDDILPPKQAAARKAALEGQLETLAQSDASKEERETARAPLDEALALLRALDEAWESRDGFRQQLETLPKRLQDLAATQRALEARQPGTFLQATEALRDQYDDELRAAQTAIQELLKQESLAEARLSAIPHELEQRRTERPKLQQSLAEARRQALQLNQSNKLDPAGEVSRLEIQLQLLITEIQELEAERQWLTNRGPLYDLRLRVEQTKLLSLRQDLDAITQALSRTFKQEQVVLSEQAEALEQAIPLAQEPVETLKLSAQLETIRIRQATAGYRQQLNQLNQEVLSQEQITAQERQHADRIAALFGKFTSGESGGESLLLAFERLRLERQRFRDDAAKKIKAKLRTFTPILYQIEDQLYYHDQKIEKQLKETLTNDQVVPRELRQVFADQKAALREQQQALAMTAQAYTTLLSLHREHRQLLDDSYYATLAKIFWLRDAERFSLSVLRDILAGIGVAMMRLQEMLRAEPAWLRATFSSAFYLLIPAGLLLAALFWVAQRLYIALWRLITSRLQRSAECGLPCGLIDALLMAIRAAVWPAFLLFLAWFRNQFIPADEAAAGLASSGLEVSAIILFAALLSRDVFRPTGWGRQFWGWPADACRFLHRIVLIGCLAAFALLLPRHLLLSLPGAGEVATASFALARFLFLLFQTIVLALVAIIGWRQSPLMEERLTRSQQQEGLLWRLWPFIYLLVLASLAGVIALDALGYRYAARFVWFRSLESVSVILLWRLLLTLLVIRMLHRAVDFIVNLWFRDRRGQSSATAPVDQVFHVVYMIGNTLLALLAGSAILEIWGVSVSWFLMSPLGGDLLRRAGVIAITVAVMILLMKISKVVTEYLVQPRTTPDGAIQHPNRKFRTMVPLTHTLLKFGVVFGAIIVVLQQLNVAIGPILTGVGIFGLAVGFASQSLIKDVINGLFILFEDSLSVGDIVTLRGISGVVEKVTLRAVTVRDLNGNVHVIPNSTLDLITNMTKEFSRQVIDVGVAYREDVDRVMEILNEVGQDLQNDPTFGWDMMRPLEIMGLHDFADSAVVIRTRLWTLPGQQFRLGREFRRRLKRVFDERGVEIPFPHRTLYWGTPKEGSQPPIPIAFDSPTAQRADNGQSRPSETAPSPSVED